MTAGSGKGADSMTALSDELKPCPFCGGAAALLPRTCDKDTPYNPADRAFPVARCGQCGAEAVGKDWGRPETAASAWNRRALLAAQPAGAWMPIPDSMPPLGEQVLVWCKFGPHWGPMVDCWDEQHEAPVSFSSATIPVGPGWDSGSEFEDVTHWMRIGAPEQAAAQPAVQQPAEDDVFTALDMSPDTFRTEGGAVNVGKLRAAIRHPADYLPPDHWLAAAAPKGTT